jgi:digeranylgeranylglycerophospholipid reductase
MSRMPQRIPDTTDVVVVGAGTAGAVAARRVAASGVRVLVVERRPAPDIGRKICGNAITDDGVAAIQKRVSPPAGPEIAMRVEAGTIGLPDGRTTLDIPGSGVILNRLVFGQRLLRDAVAAGAEVVDGCSCVGWADRSAGRIRVRLQDDTEAEITAGIVIDATGYRALLARTGGPSHDDTPARAEVGIGYREIAPVIEPFEKPVRATVVLSPDGAPAGYGWIFPMGDRLANVGLGAPLAGTARTIRDAFAAFRERADGPRFLPPIDAGSGMLPLRPPLASMVGDRFMTVGDAACQTNPLHGGGIAPSIVGGAMAGEVAARAIGRGAPSTQSLWPYNVAFMREIGAIHAAHDVLRRFLVALPARDLTFLAAVLWRTGAAGALAGPTPRVPIADSMRLLASASARPGLALAFARVVRLMESARRLYEDYPESPDRLERWRNRARGLTRAAAGLAGGAGA